MVSVLISIFLLEEEVSKLVLIFLAISFLVGVSFAQDEEKKTDYDWKKQIIGDLNFTQNEFPCSVLPKRDSRIDFCTKCISL